MTSQLAGHAAETLQRLKVGSVETVVRTQGVDAILGMAGIVHKIVRFVPRAAGRAEHEAVNGGHDLSESGRTAPVAGCTANNSMHIHERNQSAGGPGTTNGDSLTGRIRYRGRVLGRTCRSGRELALDGKRRERRCSNLLGDGCISGHK